MELTESQKLVKTLKEIKEQNEITFPRILELMEANGKTVSMSTLRRVFSNGSDPNSFSYENTLLPIKDALESIDSGEIMYAARSKEIEGLKAVIACQNEELAQLYQTKEFLQDRVRFMQDQIAVKDTMIEKLLEKIL